MSVRIGNMVRKSEWGKRIVTFLYSPYYISALALCVLLCYSFNLDVLGFGILALACVATLVLCEDTLPLVPAVLAFAVQPSLGGRETPGFYGAGSIVAFCIYGAAVLAAIVYHLIVFGGIKRLKCGGRLGAATVALGLGLLFSGFFCEYYPLSSFIWACAQIGPLCVMFFFLRATSRNRKENVTYFALSALAMGLVMCAQLAESYLFYKPFVDSGFKKDMLNVGWGISNHIGAAISQCIPLVFYLACKEEKYPEVYYLIAVVMEVCVVFTFSRAALLMGAPVLLACVIIACVKAKRRRRIWILTAVLAVVGAIGFVVLYDKIMSMMSFFTSAGFSDRGRFRIWKLGLEFFSSHPVFGVGQRYYALTSHPSYFYHNTVIQFIATGGTVGILTYAFYRVETIRIMVRKPTLERLFLALTVAMIALISLLDNGFVHIWSKGYTVFALIYAEQDLDKKDWFCSTPKLGKGKPLFIR